MQSRFVRTLVVLGTPIVVLGLLFLLMSVSGFRFSQMNPTMLLSMAILLLLVAAGLTAYAIRRFSPAKTALPLKPVQTLSAEERLILEALVRESDGVGTGVAIDRFNSNLPRLGIGKAQAPTLMASLQAKGLIALDMEVSWDNMRNCTVNNPVYRVKEAGYAACSG